MKKQRWGYYKKLQKYLIKIPDNNTTRSLKNTTRSYKNTTIRSFNKEDTIRSFNKEDTIRSLIRRYYKKFNKRILQEVTKIPHQNSR